MIELTEQQAEEIENTQAIPRVVNPRTRQTYVLLRLHEYERLMEEDDYDDSPWTREKLQATAWEVAEQTGWEQYDDVAPERA